MSAADAVSLSTRLSEIGFPEFTAKLVNDVFDAIVTANLNQTKAYLELVQAVSKTLIDFINQTKDSIGGDLILQFLATVIPDKASSAGTKITEDSTANLTAAEADAVNKAVAVTGVADPPPANTGTPIKDLYKPIIDAVAKRISADRYTLLQEMVKLGILRLVVQDGEIETKLIFTTYGSNFYSNNTKNYNRDDFVFSATAKTGGALSAWISASAATEYSRVSVTTTSTEDKSTTESSVQIFGGVKIRFKTDYQPLS